MILAAALALVLLIAVPAEALCAHGQPVVAHCHPHRPTTSRLFCLASRSGTAQRKRRSLDVWSQGLS